MNVSFGSTVRYPSDITCEKCKSKIFPTLNTIDSYTWDLKCRCGHIAYKHPLREERMQQIQDMLD